MHNLVGMAPSEVLTHGPKKVLLDQYHWHAADIGVIASYTPSLADVEDHFGLFRGVDMIESFAQASIVSLGAYLEKQKLGCSFSQLKMTFVPVFISIDKVNFHSYLESGECFISIGHITFFKFRQMTCSGRIYKVPRGLNLDDYFKGYTDEQVLSFDLPSEFIMVAELAGVTGRAFKREKLNYTNI